jgi:hypothetical protein
LLLAAEGGFIWLMLTRTKTRKPKQHKTKEVEGPGSVARSLGEGAPLDYSQPAASVTEHTTRTLQGVPRERR